MKQRTFVAVCGTLLALAGLSLMLWGGAPAVMRLFGGSGLPTAKVGDPALIGVAFMRVFGAAVLALGLITAGASRLRGEPARALGMPLALGLAVLGLVTGMEALAIWSTPTAWLLAGIIGVACVGVASLRAHERSTVTQ
jgi:hypothetical protein